jgi:very-short-patch-repair endonuclease
MGGDADRQLFALAARQDCVFTTADALASGLKQSQCEYRVASGQWLVVFGGVYQPPGVELSWRGRLRAACMAGDPGVASHRSALALWDLPGQRRHVAELLTPHGDRVRRVDVVAHQSRDLPADDLTAIDDIKVTTPARTLVDVAAVLHPTVLETTVDEALRRSLVDFATLWCRLEGLAKPGRRGIRPLRRVLAKRHPSADLAESEREAMLLRALRDAGLPAPVPQFEIHDDGGTVVARVDAAYPWARLAIEYDSYLHHGGRAKHVSDLARRNALTALGWRIVHVTAADLRAGTSLTDAVRTVLQGAA